MATSSEIRRYAIQDWEPAQIRKLGSRWKDMPVYLSNDHLIIRITPTPGAPWRIQRQDSQKRLDFKVEQRYKQTDRQTEDRPAQPAPPPRAGNLYPVDGLASPPTPTKAGPARKRAGATWDSKSKAILEKLPYSKTGKLCNYHIQTY